MITLGGSMEGWMKKDLISDELTGFWQDNFEFGQLAPPRLGKLGLLIIRSPNVRYDVSIALCVFWLLMCDDRKT